MHRSHEIEEFRALMQRVIDNDDVRPSVRAALEDLHFALAHVGIEARRRY